MNNFTPEQLGFSIITLCAMFCFFGYIVRAYRMTGLPELRDDILKTHENITHLCKTLDANTDAITKLADKLNDHEIRIKLLEHDNERGKHTHGN